MISKDESIITQVVAKIASELTGVTQTDGSQEQVQAVYLSHFDFVREVVFGAHNITPAQQVTITNATSSNGVTEAELVQMFNATPVATNSGIVIKGTQHGPIPSWLVEQASKAGVTAVYDNRDTATAENRRPMFKAADGTTNAKGQPVAFWPPKK
jgi:hypothetical protein